MKEKKLGKLETLIREEAKKENVELLNICIKNKNKEIQINA